jgi:predicted Zn finger-like uncharacterized protein
MLPVSHAWAARLNLSLAEKAALTENRGMLIACPNCAAGFDVPERLLRDRSRSLSCGQCRTVFPIPEPQAPEPLVRHAPEPSPVYEAPPAPPPAMAETPRSEPAVAPEEPPAAPKSARDGRLRAAWAASIALLIGGGLTAIIKRDALMEAWPPTIRLFAALGLV